MNHYEHGDYCVKKIDNICSKCNIISICTVGDYAQKWITKYCNYLLVYSGKRPLWRSKHRWEDNKTYVKEIGCKCVDWIHLAQDWFQSSLL
jgi:hypothetical protein